MASLGDLEWRRGDSYPITLTIKDTDTGLAIDLTSYTFKMTVNSEQDPVDTTNQQFQVIGVVDPDQVTNKGKVSFTPSESDSDLSGGTYYYDVEMTDPSGNVRTISPYKAKFKLNQDQTKN